MIVLQTGLQLSDAARTHPLIGWHNVVTSSTIAATTQDDDFPASNLANPSTNLKWKATADSPGSADEYLTITIGEIDPIDYVAVAGHNWGSAGIPVSLEYFDNVNSPNDFSELVAQATLTDDGPVIFRFASQVISQIRIRLRPGGAIPEAAVVYCGRLLVTERSFSVSTPYTPLELGREANVVSGMSDSGKFLGRIVIGQHAESQAEFQYLTPDWYRANFDPFIVASKDTPFFFAWNPSDYDGEVGYAWMTNSPKPQVDPITGRMHISLPMRGVV